MKTEKRVLIIGDSLAMPNYADKKYEDTWIYKLKTNYPNFDVITYLKRGLTTNALVSMGKKLEYGVPPGADCLEMWMPDIVILQLGVCDCAPRLFSPYSLEYKLINKFPLNVFNKPYVNLVKTYRKRSCKKAYVPPEEFEANLNNYFDRCRKRGVSKVIAIGISYPADSMLKKNRPLFEAVEIYNGIYKTISKNYPNICVIFPLDSRKYDSEIYNDGYHPNIKGHKIVFDAVEKELNEFTIS